MNYVILNKAFSFGDNKLRLHWLLRSLTQEGMALEERSDTVFKACEGASIGWLASVSGSAWNDYHPRDGKPPEPPEKCLTTESDAGRLRDILHARIKVAAQNGSLAGHRDLAFLLSCWSELAGDDGASARSWTESIQTTDTGVMQLTTAFTSYGWSQGLGFSGLGDMVAKRTTHVRIKGLEKLVDLPAFRIRVEGLASSGHAPELLEFLDALRRADQGDRN